MTPGQMLLGRLGTTRYHDNCESMGGYNNPSWVRLRQGNGQIRLYDRTFIRLAFFDHDYESFVFAQSWDHEHNNAPEGEWQYVLFFNTAQNEWVPEAIHAWGARRPTLAQVGDVIDTFCATRRVL